MPINQQKPAPFGQAPVTIIGQPFTLVSIFCPVTASLRCNCGGAPTQIDIVDSVEAACPSCRKVYNIRFNPTTNQLEVQMSIPGTAQVPS
jgi:hypothetical protein